MATRTLTADITVRQEMTRLRVVELLTRLLYKLACIIHLAEIVCRELMVNSRRRAGVDIETDTEIRKRTFD